MPTALGQILGSGNRWQVVTANTTMVAGAAGYLTVGGDPNWASVTSYLRFNGANGSTTFTDEVAGLTWTAQNQAQVTTTTPRFGSGALLLDGSGDRLVPSSQTPFTFSGNFTIEFWIRLESTPTAISSVFSTANDTFPAGSGIAFYFLATQNTLRVFDYGVGSDFFAGGVTATVGQWVHVALVRSGSTMTLYANGVSVGTATKSGTLTATNTTIGAWLAGTNSPNTINGRLDDFRVTNGVARYTANFTPPSFEFPANAGTDPDLSVPASIAPGDPFIVYSAVGGARILPGAGRQIGTAGVGTAVTLTTGQTLRIVARNATQLDIV